MKRLLIIVNILLLLCQPLYSAELGDGSGTDYPTSLDTDSTLEVDSPSGSATTARANVPNDIAAAIIAIETELGLNPSGTAGTVVDRLDDIKSEMPTNSSTSAGFVSTGSGQVNKVWKTDASGNPSWRADGASANAFDFYIEEGDSAEDDNTDADLTLDFADADFDVTTAADECDVVIHADITRDSEWNTEAEVETAWSSANIIIETEIDDFSEVQALVSDKTLVNEEDAATFDNTVIFDALTGQGKQTTTLDPAETELAITDNFVVLTGDGGANTLATITGGTSGQILTIIFTDANVTITDTAGHGSNTVDLSGAFTSADDTVLMLINDGTSWYEVSRSVN